MKPRLFLALAILAVTPVAAAQDVPGGKSLAELVRERFEANPPQKHQVVSKASKREVLPPAPPVAPVSLGPARPETDNPPKPAETAPASATSPEQTGGTPAAPDETGQATLPATKNAPPPDPPEKEPKVTKAANEPEEPAEKAAPDEAPPETAEMAEVAADQEDETQAPAAGNDFPLPDLAPPSLTHTIKPGDTLTRVARSAYNASLFSSLLEEHNDVNPRRLRIGQEISTPSLSDLVREQGPKLLATFPEAASLLVRTQHDYRSFEELHRNNAPKDERTEAMEKLTGAVTRIEEILGAEHEMVSRKPRQVLDHLDRFRKNLAAIEAGRVSLLSSSGVRNRTYLAGALIEAMKWGETW